MVAWRWLGDGGLADGGLADDYGVGCVVCGVWCVVYGVVAWRTVAWRIIMVCGVWCINTAVHLTTAALWCLPPSHKLCDIERSLKKTVMLKHCAPDDSCTEVWSPATSCVRLESAHRASGPSKLLLQSWKATHSVYRSGGSLKRACCVSNQKTNKEKKRKEKTPLVVMTQPA